jgi:transposase-like protein
MGSAEADVLAYLTFPPVHWRQIWSNNPLERVESLALLDAPKEVHQIEMLAG